MLKTKPVKTKATGIEIIIEAEILLGIICWTTYALYAPIIINSPWAILITPTTPKVIAKPMAASKSTEPRDKPKPPAKIKVINLTRLVDILSESPTSLSNLLNLTFNFTLKILSFAIKSLNSLI